MTVLTLGPAACNCAARFIETGLPVGEPEAAQRVADALRECAEWHSGARVHIELEPIEPEEGATGSAELRLVQPDKSRDLALVLELAERFMAEGALADATPTRRRPYAVAIERIKATHPELAG